MLPPLTRIFAERPCGMRHAGRRECRKWRRPLRRSFPRKGKVAGGLHRQMTALGASGEIGQLRTLLVKFYRTRAPARAARRPRPPFKNYRKRSCRAHHPGLCTWWFTRQDRPRVPSCCPSSIRTPSRRALRCGGPQGVRVTFSGPRQPSAPGIPTRIRAVLSSINY
jgi:hypothetical protein